MLAYIFLTFIHLANGHELICTSTAPGDISFSGQQLDIIATECVDDKIFSSGFES